MQKESKLGYYIVIALFVIISLVLLGTTIWSYSRFADERDNTDKKVVAAEARAREDQRVETTLELEEANKLPFRTYLGPANLSGIKVSYPKSWSAYVDEANSSATVELALTLHPNIIQAFSVDSRYAFRLELVDSPYSDVTLQYERLVETQQIQAQGFELLETTGVRFDGEISNAVFGTMIILPIRDKSLKVWTESNDYLDDFETIVTENLEFNP